MMVALRLLEEFPSCLMELRETLIITSMCCNCYKARVCSGFVCLDSSYKAKASYKC